MVVFLSLFVTLQSTFNYPFCEIIYDLLFAHYVSSGYVSRVAGVIIFLKQTASVVGSVIEK
jgi:hypothetical protein